MAYHHLWSDQRPPGKHRTPDRCVQSFFEVGMTNPACLPKSTDMWVPHSAGTPSCTYREHMEVYQRGWFGPTGLMWWNQVPIGVRKQRQGAAWSPRRSRSGADQVLLMPDSSVVNTKKLSNLYYTKYWVTCTMWRLPHRMRYGKQLSPRQRWSAVPPKCPCSQR